MHTPSRIKGVTVRTILDGRSVDVVFRSPYRWRIYDGERDVTREFGFPLTGHCIEHDAERAAFHAKVDAGAKTSHLHTAKSPF